MMKRREFIVGLGGAAVGWPMYAAAQPSRKLPTIGFLGTASQAGWRQWTAAFEQRLRELGWIEGHTLLIDFRWADGKTERFAEIASEFVQRDVNVIVTTGTAVPAAKQATSVIPIVFAIAVDPLGTGLVAVSPARAATSRAYRCRASILSASVSNCCENLCLALDG